MTDDPSASPGLVHFPPLPPQPEPPHAGADPRQSNLQRITANLAGLLGDGMQLGTTNTTHGFHAAAVDLGRLKAALEEGLRRFDIASLHARWEVDIRDWAAELLPRWVQRLKEASFDLRDNGVHVRLRTQDDLGYYDYAFDIFPGRRPRAGS
jgi:hypothetical protein